MRTRIRALAALLMATAVSIATGAGVGCGASLPAVQVVPPPYQSRIDQHRAKTGQSALPLDYEPWSDWPRACRSGGSQHRGGGRTWAVVAVDVSESTAMASGHDVNGDGVLGTLPQGFEGFWNPKAVPLSSDPGDSVFAAQLLGLRGFLAQDARPGDRLGLVSFSGFESTSGRPSAVALIGLSHEPSDFEGGLRQIEAAGPDGSTDYAAAIDASLALFDESPTAGTAVKKRILLISDGVPTLPVPPGARSDPGDWAAAIEAAERAARQGITLDIASFTRVGGHLARLSEITAPSSGRIFDWTTADSLEEAVRCLIAGAGLEGPDRAAPLP